MALEDLGAASDFFPLYSRGIELPEQTFTELVAYLFALHRLAPSDQSARERLANREIMRRLIGVAQIPTLRADLPRKAVLLEQSGRPL